jgi:DUF438 domain-containing protein
MELSPKTKVATLLDAYPFLLDFLPTLNAKFSLLKNPVMRKTVGNVATLGQVAAIGGMPVEELIEKIAVKIEQETGQRLERSEQSGEQPEVFSEPQARHEMLKDIIRDLHAGGNFEQAKQRFAELIRDIDASEIAAMEQKLMAEGMPETEVKRLCDVHVQVFKESLETKEAPMVDEGHPVHTFMLENRAQEKLITHIEEVLTGLGPKPDEQALARYRPNLKRLLESIQKVNLHYLRKENQLFPILEKYGITGPSQVMWSLDDDIRALIKKCLDLLDKGITIELLPAIRQTMQALRDMIYKEEHILFPMTVETLSADDWDKVRQGEEEVGYAWIFPVRQPPQETPTHAGRPSVIPGALPFDTGHMTLEQVNMLLKVLPLDLSLVDENDEVIYYSATRERIFPRSPGVIGRKVQNCHPPKSMPRVQEILNDFRDGTRDEAQFWIQSQGRFILITYYALRDETCSYRGCLEVTQDVTAIRGLEGEKRLLD